MLEVYMDDIIVKSCMEELHTQHLQRVFKKVRQYNIQLNPEKCTFELKIWKFLGFYLTEQGIKANPDKSEVVIQMSSPMMKREVHKLNDMLIALIGFISKSAQHALPFLQFVKEKAGFEWTTDWEEALESLKKILTMLPILTWPLLGKIFYLYLDVGEEAVSTILIREFGDS